MLPTIIQRNLALAVALDLLMEHCRKFDIATSQRELGRRARMLPSTLNAISRKKHAPTLENLVALAVASGVSLAGLLCVDLWRVNSGVEKMAIQNFEFPDRRSHLFHKWEDVEKHVMKEIAKGNAELPWPMARKLGICEKQFCLRSPNASKALREAVQDKALFSAECERLKTGLKKIAEEIQQQRIQISRAEIARKLGSKVCRRVFQLAWREIFPPSLVGASRRNSAARATAAS